MHRLTRAFGQSTGDDETRTSARSAFLTGVVERARLIDPHAGFRVYLPDRAHFDAALSLADTGSDAKQRSDLLTGIGTAAQSLGDLPRARDLLELALQSDLQNLGENHPNVATWRYNLADLYAQTGELPAALALLELVLDSEAGSLGTDHPARAQTRAKLAQLLSRTGETERAREEAREALRVVQSQPEGSVYRRSVEIIVAGLV